jgi:membrane-bound metal-dependent hydrolase YbcI (DUF457 family)
MPSPIGHALAGLAVASLAPHATSTARPDRQASRSTSLAWWCLFLALLPDADLLWPLLHRRVTHSVTAAVAVFIIAAGVTRWVTGRITWRTAFLCGLAYGSHLLLDWLGADPNPPYGIRLLWPFSNEWFIADWPIFPPTERRSLLSWTTFMINARAALFECASVGLVVAALWSLRRKRRPPQSVEARTDATPS